MGDALGSPGGFVLAVSGKASAAGLCRLVMSCGTWAVLSELLLKRLETTWGSWCHVCVWQFWCPNFTHVICLSSCLVSSQNHLQGYYGSDSQ